MADEASGAEQVEQPWLMPREYEIGGVRWFSDTVREMQRALHPLLAQIPRVELADRPARPAEGEPLPPEASSLYRPTLSPTSGGCPSRTSSRSRLRPPRVGGANGL